MRIEPSGQILGATVTDIDIGAALTPADFAAVLQGLGRHGVLHFPGQRLTAAALRDFSQRFGRIQATLTGRHHEPGMPEVGILSNIIENGEPIGITDAGQDWHTDMSYNPTIGFLNELAHEESERMLSMLFEHQLPPKYQYTHRWTEDDVLVWDHIGTLHNAIADYGPDEHRLMKRCQVMADRVFDPAFLEAVLPAAGLAV